MKPVRCTVFVLICLVEGLLGVGPSARGLLQPCFVSPPDGVLRLREGAPPEVALWFSLLPQIKRMVTNEMRRDIESLENYINELRAELSRLSRAPLPTVTAGRDSFGAEIRQPDRQELARRQERMKEIRRELPKLHADLKRKREELVAHEATNPWVGVAEWNAERPELIGWLRTVFVFQVIGDDSMLVRQTSDGEIYMLVGLNTARIADGDRLTLPKPVASTGTRSYTNVLGGRRTVRVLEMFNPLPWVEVVPSEGDAEP